VAKSCVVFISSTSEDLKEYRAAARDAALSAGFRPVMMEYFAASGGQPLRECLDRVSPCDPLVVIVAHRYGWVPRDQHDGDAKSITWLECEQAVRQGKEVLVFLLHKDARWPAESRESHRTTAAIEEGTDTPELIAEVKRNLAQLKDFKQWLDERTTRATFTNPDDLRANVVSALLHWRRRHPEYGEAEPASPGDPRTYLNWLSEQTATIDIRGLGVGSGKAHNFPIEDLYIPLTTAAGAQFAQHKAVQLQDALVHRRLVIVGDPGSGKTTFLRRIAFAFAEASIEVPAAVPLPPSPAAASLLDLLRASSRTVEGGWLVFLLFKYLAVPLPLLIRIAELAEHIRNCRGRHGHSGPTTETAPAWIADFLNRRNAEMNWGLNPEFFARKLEDGSAIVLLDGLDEAPNRPERERMARLFEEATQAYRRCRFVVTTRPQSYEGRSLLKDFQEARIEPLGSEAVQLFLEHWCQGLYPEKPRMAQSHLEELREALCTRSEIRRMASNPVMLTALAVVHWNERRLPEQRADLYDSILTWLSRSREKRPGRETAERCLALLQELALEMQDHRQGRQVRVSNGWAAEKLAPEFSQVPERERYRQALEFLEQEQADSGIVVSRGGDVQFWHLTFQEHLAACAIAGRGDSTQYALLLKDDKLYRTEWREVALLLAGILHVKQGKGKVDGLVSAILGPLGARAKLAQQARCASLVGAIVRDLQPLRYEPSDHQYKSLMAAVLGVFGEGAEAIEFKLRLEAAEALGQAGDPRIGKNNWVKMEAGTFLMGESPGRQVDLKSYEIGRYPVTVEEYARFVEDEGYGDERRWKAGGFARWSEPRDWEDQGQHGNRPVTGVSWYEAMAYCEWNGVRLPSDSEWERAARGLSGREYPWGNEKPDRTRANHNEGKLGHATPVGLYPRGATPEGIQDLAGNVWEWVADWFREGTSRVIRGGSWDAVPQWLRVSYRGWDEPDGRNGYLGFRCVRK
jgi:formylglycine-generating enzyme required for sulfatase activity